MDETACGAFVDGNLIVRICSIYIKTLDLFVRLRSYVRTFGDLEQSRHIDGHLIELRIAGHTCDGQQLLLGSRFVGS